MATIGKKKKKIGKNSVGNDIEKLEPFCTNGGTVKWHNHCGKQYVSSSKNLKNIIMYNPAMLLVGITEVRIFKSLLYTHDYSSIVYISWNVEETQVSISQMWYIPTTECYSAFKKKEIQ